MLAIWASLPEFWKGFFAAAGAGTFAALVLLAKFLWRKFKKPKVMITDCLPEFADQAEKVDIPPACAGADPPRRKSIWERWP